jgi:hypothetical protein
MTSQLAMESNKDINIDLSRASGHGVIQILNKRLMMNISYLQKQEIITGTLLDLISVKDINFSKNGMNK